MIVDAHIHAGHGDELTASWSTFEDIEVSLRRMDQVGIDRAVVLPIGLGSFVKANEETAEIVSRYPDRLYGFAKVHQEHDRGRIKDMLKRAFEELDLRGLKLHGTPNREIMDAVAPYKVPVLCDPLGEPMPLRYAAQEYPEVPIIVAHFGSFLSRNQKAHLESIWLAEHYPNIYLDTSGVCLHEWLERAVEELGPERIIFGSDGPGLHCGVELARIKVLNLPPDQEDLILGGNILRLLGEER